MNGSGVSLVLKCPSPFKSLKILLHKILKSLVRRTLGFQIIIRNTLKYITCSWTSQIFGFKNMKVLSKIISFNHPVWTLTRASKEGFQTLRPKLSATRLLKIWASLTHKGWCKIDIDSTSHIPDVNSIHHVTWSKSKSWRHLQDHNVLVLNRVQIIFLLQSGIATNKKFAIKISPKKKLFTSN